MIIDYLSLHGHQYQLMMYAIDANGRYEAYQNCFKDFAESCSVTGDAIERSTDMFNSKLVTK